MNFWPLMVWCLSLTVFGIATITEFIGMELGIFLMGCHAGYFFRAV